MQVDQRATFFAGNRYQRAFKRFATVACGRSENISDEAMRMHPDKDWLIAGINVTSHQREMRIAAIHFALVGNDAKLAMPCVHQCFSHTMDVALVLHAIAD